MDVCYNRGADLQSQWPAAARFHADAWRAAILRSGTIPPPCSGVNGSCREGLVRAVGIEPTLLAERDFESRASTNSTTPAHLPPILADALCTYTAPRAKTEYRQPLFLPSQLSENTPFQLVVFFLWIGRQTTL